MLLPVIYRKDDSVLCYKRIDKDLPIQPKGKYQQHFVYKFVADGKIIKEMIDDDLTIKGIIPPNNINQFDNETDYYIALGISKNPASGQVVGYKYVVQNSAGSVMYVFDVEFVNHYILLST